MRIAVFTKKTTFHEGYGGLETQNKVLTEGLSDRGHEVVVFSPKLGMELENIEVSGVNYVFIHAVYRMGIFFQVFEDKISAIFKKLFPGVSLSGFLSSKGKEDWIAKSYQKFKNYHDEKPFDIVLCQSSVGLGILRNKEELGVKVISISHGTILGEYTTLKNNLKPYKKLLSPGVLLKFIRDTAYVFVNYFTRQREFVLKSDHVVAVSEYVKSALIDETYVDSTRVTVIHNGVELVNTHNLKTSEDPWINFVYLGRIDKSKGLFVFMEALNKLKKVDDFRFNAHIIGDGDDMNSLKEYTSKLDLDADTIFYGNISHEDVMPKLVEMDVFVLPSIRVEGFPMVLAEAMLAGLPVIASDIGGNSDAIVDGETGFLVEPGNSDALHDALLDIGSDKEKRLLMGSKGKSIAEKEFTLDVMIDKYEQVIKRVTDL